MIRPYALSWRRSVGLERPPWIRRQRSGVAPAQHGVLPASKFVLAVYISSSPLGTCSIAMVNARVNDRVIYVFHALFTLLHRRKRLKLFEIVEPSIKEVSKPQWSGQNRPYVVTSKAAM